MQKEWVVQLNGVSSVSVISFGVLYKLNYPSFSLQIPLCLRGYKTMFVQLFFQVVNSSDQYCFSGL
jgi:hypothetical protein